MRVLASARVTAPAPPHRRFPMTIADFKVPWHPDRRHPGRSAIHPSGPCSECHGSYDPDHEPYQTWRGSLMAQAGRDPLFFAQMTTANQDIANVGYYCMRCHVPMSFVTGHATEPNGGTLDAVDRDGVSCHFCHSMLDPEYEDGVSPPEDQSILSGLADVPTEFGNAMFVLDPTGLRRGPYSDATAEHDTTESPFHSTERVLWDLSRRGQCRDQRSSRTAPMPTTPSTRKSPDHDPHAQFPLERTYTEWKLSAFANGGVDMGGALRR